MRDCTRAPYGVKNAFPRTHLSCGSDKPFQVPQTRSRYVCSSSTSGKFNRSTPPADALYGTKTHNCAVILLFVVPLPTVHYLLSRLSSCLCVDISIRTSETGTRNTSKSVVIHSDKTTRPNDKRVLARNKY